MKKGVVALFIALGAFVLFSAPAFAITQITLLSSTSDMTFGYNGSAITVCPTGGGCTLTGDAAYQINGVTQGSIGTYTITFDSSGGVGTLSPSGGETYSYAANSQTITFSYSDGTNTLDGTLTLTSIGPGDSSSPQFVGLVTPTSVTGSTAFINTFNTNDHIDWTLSSLSPTFDTLMSGGGTANAPISGGQLYPVPEPTSMLLLGSGLLGLAFLWRKKKEEEELPRTE